MNDFLNKDTLIVLCFEEGSGKGWHLPSLSDPNALCRTFGAPPSFTAPDPRPYGRGYVRLKARVVGEVKVLFRQTLSGL
jgi:hypothetical protein